jgi:hypothetical protein
MHVVTNFASRQICPSFSIPKELRRIKKQEELEEFSRFEVSYGEAVWDQVLKHRREAEGNPNWRPSWIKGVHYQSQVHKILRQRFYAGSGFAITASPPRKCWRPRPVRFHSSCGEELADRRNNSVLRKFFGKAI